MYPQQLVSKMRCDEFHKLMRMISFSMFENEVEAGVSHDAFNTLHSVLNFIWEKENEGFLLFLDVRIHRSGFFTSIYRKSTFTDLYTVRDSF